MNKKRIVKELKKIADDLDMTFSDDPEIQSPEKLEALKESVNRLRDQFHERNWDVYKLDVVLPLRRGVGAGQTELEQAEKLASDIYNTWRELWELFGEFQSVL